MRSDGLRTGCGACFWVSGTPGTRVRHALAALKDAFQKRNRLVEIVSVEDELLISFARYKHPTDSIEREKLLTDLKKSGGFKKILDEAPPIVQELWREAAESACKKVQDYLHSGDVFLTFHAVYYADKFGDLYSPIDAGVIQKFPQPAKFLTLIDDIGDVATRLREEGHVFSIREKIGLQSVVDAIRDLLTVLEWRATELTVSRLLGSLIGCPLFVLAVKHPVQTAVRILLNEGIPAYISHSISESRRTFAKKKDWPPYMEEVQRFTDTLGNPKEGKAGNNKAIPVVPTSIDELRIESRKINGEDILIPRLLERWKPPKENLLVPAPNNPGSENWLDPRGHFSKKLEAESFQRDRKTKSELRAVDGLLQALRTRIENQINARDHMLVAQCPYLVVYRPYVAWRISDGVAAEIAHQERLVRQSQRKGMTIFFHRTTDKGLRNLGIIVEGSQSYFRWVQGAAEVPEREIRDILKEKLEQQPPPSFSPSDIESHVKKILKGQGIEFGSLRGIREKGMILGKPSAAGHEEEERRVWEQISADVEEADEWRARANHWIERDLTPEAFTKKLNEIVMKQKKSTGLHKKHGIHPR